MRDPPQAFDVDLAHFHRPEAAGAGLVAEVSARRVDRPGEHALPGALDRSLAIRWSEAIDGARHEGFYLTDFGARHAVQFGELDNPYTASLQAGVLRPDLG